jgi:hypothetical protein
LRTIELDPDFPSGYVLINLLRQQSRYDEAEEILQRYLERLRPPPDDESATLFFDSLATVILAAVRDPALVSRAVLFMEDRNMPLRLFSAAGFESFGAMDQIQEGVSDRMYGLAWVNWLHYASVLRIDPRYEAVLQAIGLPLPK